MTTHKKEEFTYSEVKNLYQGLDFASYYDSYWFFSDTIYRSSYNKFLWYLQIKIVKKIIFKTLFLKKLNIKWIEFYYNTKNYIDTLESEILYSLEIPEINNIADQKKEAIEHTLQNLKLLKEYKFYKNNT